MLSRLLLLAFFCCCAETTFVSAAEPTLDITADATGIPTAFVARGLTAQQLTELGKLAATDPRWPRILGVYVADASTSGAPAMLGAYTVTNQALQFTPQFPLRPGVTYRAELRLAELAVGGAAKSQAIVREVALPAPKPGVPTKLTAIYPSAKELPENQLRFYLHFSAPMARGEAYPHLKLLDGAGQAVDLPFLELGEELWDASGQRLTLLIDPGRIKQGVKPREDLGPVLTVGGRYTLVVDANWRDAQGQPLAAAFEKQFTVSQPIRTAIDPAAWKTELPQPGTQTPLVVRFPRPLDHALVERTFTLVAANQTPVAGTVAITDAEQTWSFTPTAPWPAGRYELVIDTTLEDVAGNRIGRAFELDRFDSVDRRQVAEQFRLPVEIRP